jgi:DNA-binding GntR family transcriptional regulator
LIANTTYRRRITYRNDRPTSASTSWYDGALADVAPKLLESERIREGTPRYIEAMTGRRIVSGRDQVGARPATAQDAEDLALEPGTAVLHGRNWYLDEQGDVVEYGEYASEGDRLRSYEYLIGG